MYYTKIFEKTLGEPIKTQKTKAKTKTKKKLSKQYIYI